MRKLSTTRWIIGALAASLALPYAQTAAAQTEGPDVLQTTPNVLLLVDNSGSMEWKSSSDQPPVCDPTTPNTTTVQTNEKSRWIELLEVLTGTINQYSCYAEKRDSSTNFSTEFRLSTTDLPYDLGYEEAYHRPMSNLCAPGPGLLPPPATPYDFPPGSIAYRPYQGGGIALGVATPCTFDQARDGLLDAFDGAIRFGLMTFDPHPDPGTGVLGGAADNRNGLRGTWSYYVNSPSHCKIPGNATNCVTGAISDPAGCCTGSPSTCPTPSAYEVGARNAAAPPWEGRMVAFGPPSEDGTLRNQWIQQILLATRPYGATPIAGMLSDARDFFWYDETPDPLNPGKSFGPAPNSSNGDPLVAATCRQNYIILLTDGEPNMDLRPDCESGALSANCPYDRSEELANEMVTSTTNPKVRTFVVGFALGQISAGDAGVVDCKTMSLSMCNPMPADPNLRACCVLNNIAYNGTPPNLRGKLPAVAGDTPDDHAFFPRNPIELRGSLSKIFQTLLNKTTGRTYPVTVAVPTNDASGAKGYEFSSGTLPKQGGLWQGVLNRTRFVCDGTNTAQPQPITPSAGDDFIANVNSAPDRRTIFSVEPDTIGGTIRQATWSMRPYLSTSTPNDGVGYYKGTQTAYVNASSFSTSISPESMNVTAASCGTTTAGACRTQLLDWAVGLPSASPVSRCPTGGCSVVGDIFHSVPQVRPGPPADFLRDSTYAEFAAFFAKRDTTLYTSSNDGFFHSFLVTLGDPTDTRNKPVTTLHNNELWAFIPPAILPSFITMYPGSTAGAVNRIPALDGVPIIKDVAATKGGGRPFVAQYPYVFERKKAADVTKGESHTWRTIVAEAFGPKRGGYFALDITQPTIDTADLQNTGPKFLWQLTTDDKGNQLFGKGSSTPLITTIYMRTNQTPEPNREVAVAVLPGGLGDPPTSNTPSCPNDADNATAIDANGLEKDYRPQIRCYDASLNSIAARSVTIVRLDTGEIVRTFRPASSLNLLGLTLPVQFPLGASTNVTDYTWDRSGQRKDLGIAAPIVGTPVAYPAQTGAVADRIFVGDVEGRIWRIDVSNPDPAQWAMNLFFDPYVASGSSPGESIGQPLQTPPVLSVDGKGQITVAFSTGDQDNLAPDPDPANPATFNYVASVTEQVLQQADGSRLFKAQLNFKETFKGGKRVLGPMTLFNKTLYYSTFEQSVSGGCADMGTSSLYAVDYLQPKTPGTPLSGALVQTGFPTDYPNVIISGVGLRQLPSCSTTATVGASSDDFLGYGTVTSSTTTVPGKFELVFHKGGASATATKIATDKVELAPPKAAVRIDSWAPVIE